MDDDRSPGDIDVATLFSLAGKTAVITGGSRGIGAMIAEGFVKAGAKVLVASRNAQACRDTAQRLAQWGWCASVPADLSSAEGCGALADAVAEQVTAVDILVNNAGTAWGQPLATYSASGFDKVLALNVRAPFVLTQKMLPLLEAAATPQEPARVINIGSIDAIRVPDLESYAYTASKAAVHQLTRHLAKVLVERHIHVNAIAPGLFATKMTAFMFDDPGSQIIDQIPAGRAGHPEDIAGLALLLASRAGSYFVGSVIPVDGGAATLR